MEFFGKTSAVRLRSHLDKYLVADEDQSTVRQSRHGGSKRATWRVEVVEGKSDLIRLRSCFGRYMTASDIPFLLGMTGKKVVLTAPESPPNWKVDWSPERDGVQVRLRSWCGKLLRANGGVPPWRSSVTHDEPHSGATVGWVLWTVEPAAESTEPESLTSYLSSMSSLSSVSDDLLSSVSADFRPGSPVSTIKSLKSARLSMKSTNSPKLCSTKEQFKRSGTVTLTPPPQPFNSDLTPKSQRPSARSATAHIKNTATSPTHARHAIDFGEFGSGMDLFRNAKAVRLRSHHDKYLLADEGEEAVTQDRNGSSKTARWTVEPVAGSDSILRLKSCYGRYLTASNQPFLLGMTGRKVLQTVPKRLDSSVEWEPVREGPQVKLRTRYGNFLRANGGLPPWRNSITHDVPHRTATQDWVLWDVDIVEIEVRSPAAKPGPVQPAAFSHSDSMGSETDMSTPSSVSFKSADFSRQESSDSFTSSPPKSEGRVVCYHIADDNGDVEGEGSEGYSMTFKGNGVEELTKKLEEETGLEGLIVCSRSPLNGKLFPLRLQLPPNKTNMHVVVVPSSSRAARDFAK